MNKVTKEWAWLLCAMVASLLCVIVLISIGVKPALSLPRGIYAIVLPIALVYSVRLVIDMVKLARKKRSPDPE